MANENQNTGPSREQTRQTIADINEAKKAGGDFNDILKDSVNQLKKIANLYDDIESRLKSMDKSSINIKQINTQLFKAKEKDAITTKKLQEAEAKLGVDSENKMKQYLSSQAKIAEMEQRRLKYERLGLIDKAKSVDYLMAKEIVRNERLKEGLDISELEVISLRESEKYTKAIVELAKQKLKEEKEVRKELGYSGAAMGLFAKKLGLGNEIYDQMVEKAKNLKDQGKSITFFDKLGILSKGVAGGALDALKDPLTMIPIAGAAIGGVVKGFMTLVEMGLEAQDTTVKFGRSLGLSAKEAQNVRNQFFQISMNSNSILVNTRKLMESQQELSSELGVNNILSAQILETNIKLKDLAGLDAQTRAEIAKSSVLTGKSSEGITKSILGQVGALKQAKGISFGYQQILKEASSLGGVLGLSFAKYPEKLTKSLVAVKSMGMELKQLDSMADSFLDFESSISKEFEAQLLTGRDINLAKAREAFLNNDLATAAQEITSQVGTSNDYLNMNRIQQESIASAMGMSRDQMADMLKQQEFLSKLGAKDLKDAQAKVDALKAQGKSRAEIIALTGEEAYQSLTNASAQEKIAGFMDKIKQSIADFVANSPLIPIVERAIDWLSKPSNIQKIVSYIQDAFAFIFDIVGKTSAVIMRVANFFGAGIGQDLIQTASSGGQAIRGLNLSGAIPASVGDQNAKVSAGGSTAPNSSDNMSMNRGQGNNVTNLQVVTYVDDHPRKAEIRNNRTTSFDGTIYTSK